MPEYKKSKMTNWYAPMQLIDTAKRTVISTTVGQYADPRAGEADPKHGKFFDYSKHLVPNKFDFEEDTSQGAREEIWIDYAADVGDGFNPTYAVAYYLSQPSLSLPSVSDPLPRGEILFLGGDGVYPTANSDRYENQLVTPYRMAFKAGAEKGRSPLDSELPERPHIFALPGNHDWYDSLVAFKQLFCSHIFNDRKFAADDKGNGGWTTRQRRSYFTLKLPQKWWLLAVDLQLNHNIDVSQLLYFESIIEQMDAGDKVILCVPEPYWEKHIKYQKVTDKYEEKERSIRKLDRYLSDRKVEVRAFIAGDLHHYRRFADATGVQKITAGGGGAFLHPTHDFDFRKAERENRNSSLGGFTLKDEYPEYKVSRKIGWRDLGFLFHNWKFGVVTGIIYFALALLIRGRVNGNQVLKTDAGSLSSFLWEAIKVTINRMIEEPLVILVVILLLLGLVFFTDSESKRYKHWAGSLHGIAHLIATFFLGWLGYELSLLVSKYLVLTDRPTAYNLIWFFSVLAVCGIGGYIVGSFIMGIYLFISLHVFGRHSNEAFSALKIQDYKNFLRMHIDKNGTLTIYPIKIETVPRKWKDEGEYFSPSDGTAPALIENAPIVVR